MGAIIEFYNQIDVFILVFTRIISILIIAPIFSENKIPAMAKTGLSFITSILIIYSSPAIELDYNGNMIGYGMLILKEVMVGMIIGFIIYMMFQIFYFVGHLISSSSGLSMSNMYDPSIGQQVPVIGNLYYYVAIALFLATNGHHIIFKGLMYSYTLIPIGQGHFNQTVVAQIITMLNNYFIISIKIASPVMVTVFIIDFALGILARTAPQMNMFVIGFPVKIMAALLMVLTTTALISTAYGYVFDQIQINLVDVLQGLRK